MTPGEGEGEGMMLIITERDLDPVVQGTLIRMTSGDRVLGGERDARQVVMDALPSAIAKRLEAIIPKEFELREVEMKCALGGTVFGCSINGEVKVRFAPASTKP